MLLGEAEEVEKDNRVGKYNNNIYIVKFSGVNRPTYDTQWKDLEGLKDKTDVVKIFVQFSNLNIP